MAKELYKLFQLEPWELYLYSLYFEHGLSCRKIADEVTRFGYKTNYQRIYKLVKEVQTKLN